LKCGQQTSWALLHDGTLEQQSLLLQQQRPKLGSVVLPLTLYAHTMWFLPVSVDEGPAEGASLRGFSRSSCGFVDYVAAGCMLWFSEMFCANTGRSV
jgi:hypothetical protein